MCIMCYTLAAEFKLAKALSQLQRGEKLGRCEWSQMDVTALVIAVRAAATLVMLRELILIRKKEFLAISC